MVRHPLPEEYEKACQLLKFFLDQSIDGPIEAFSKGMPASPPLRSFFYREPYYAGQKGNQIMPRKTFDDKKDPLFWLFCRIWDKDAVKLFGLSLLTEVRIDNGTLQYDISLTTNAANISHHWERSKGESENFELGRASSFEYRHDRRAAQATRLVLSVVNQNVSSSKKCKQCH